MKKFLSYLQTAVVVIQALLAALITLSEVVPSTTDSVLIAGALAANPVARLLAWKRISG
jgi:hypothetical protein